MTPLRWGVLGVSGLVGRRAVLPALQRSATAELIAVASRSAERAAAEASRFGAPRWYGGYEELLADPAIEAVYLPLPNALHLPWTLAAAQAGKHVLCEKPLAASAAEARQMDDACRGAGVHLAEAYMSPFHPVDRRVRALVAGGALGEILAGRAVFTFPHGDPADHRWGPGGGALLDVGIYCLEPLRAALGDAEPASLAGAAIAGPGGVDATFSGWLGYDDGRAATFTAGFDAAEEQRLELIGNVGTLAVEGAFTAGDGPIELQLRRRDGHRERTVVEGADPYLAMVEHFARVVRLGEPPARPVAASIATLELIDRLRTAAGLPPFG